MEDLTPQDVSMLEKFKAKTREFSDAFNRLTSMRVDAQSSQSMRDEYADLVETGQSIKDKIQYITQKVDDATGFFSNLFDFDGFGMVRNSVNRHPVGLGILPLIPIALMGGALAYMGSYIADIYLFERKITEQKRLESQGYNADDASQIVQRTVKKGMFAGAADIAKPVGFAVGAFILFKIVQ
jgi:hypothetical protein